MKKAYKIIKMENLFKYLKTALQNWIQSVETGILHCNFRSVHLSLVQAKQNCIVLAHFFPAKMKCTSSCISYLSLVVKFTYLSEYIS